MSQPGGQKVLCVPLMLNRTLVRMLPACVDLHAVMSPDVKHQRSAAGLGSWPVTGKQKQDVIHSH